MLRPRGLPRLDAKRNFAPMGNNEDILRTLETRRAELGLSQKDVGRAAFGRFSSDALQNIRRGASPSYDKLKALADALGLELYFGPRRASDEPRAVPLAAEDFVPVDRLDLALSAGAGAQPDAGPPGAALAFRRDWLARIGLAPGDGVVVSVRGDSMLPTLHDGDLVLIDRRRILPRPGRAYALTDIDDLLKVKRVDADPGAGVLLIRSDNPAEPALLRTGPDAARVIIHGEVVWSGHSWR